MANETNESPVNGGTIIPGSRRPDGSLRKEIRVRAGYTAPDEVEVYKNKTADNWKRRNDGPAPGAQFVSDNDASTAGNAPSAAANKNAKRREARKKAAVATSGASSDQTNGANGEKATNDEATTIDPAEAAAKEARKMAKKLRQARELKDKKEQGGALLPEQLAKVIKIQELIRQLDMMGFDSEGEKKEEKVAEGVTSDDATATRKSAATHADSDG